MQLQIPNYNTIYISPNLWTYFSPAACNMNVEKNICKHASIIYNYRGAMNILAKIEGFSPNKLKKWNSGC